MHSKRQLRDKFLVVTLWPWKRQAGRQTRLKTLPSRKLRMQAVKNLDHHTCDLRWINYAQIIVTTRTPDVAEFWYQSGTVLWCHIWHIVTTKPLIRRHIVIGGSICEHPSAICVCQTNPHVAVTTTSASNQEGRDWWLVRTNSNGRFKGLFTRNVF